MSCLIIITSNKKISKDIGFTNNKIIYDTFDLQNIVTDVITFNELTYDNIKEIIKMKKVKAPLEDIIKESNYKEIGAKRIDYLLSKRKVLVK